MGCGGAAEFVNRGDSPSVKWLKSEVARTATRAINVPEKKKITYQAQFCVEVAETKDRGTQHNSKERSKYPDLKLYVRLPDQQVLQVGKKANAISMLAEYPIPLTKNDTVEVRLVDEKGSYLKVRYDSRYHDDWKISSSKEVPLAQFSFRFEGPGRYYFHNGYGLFFIDFRQLN